MAELTAEGREAGPRGNGWTECENQSATASEKQKAEMRGELCHRLA